jgi:TfoX/Sxy family transcriptional regulator of competence genes
MATSPETAAFRLEQLDGRGVSLRKMFGEYGVYADGKMVALLCDDALFVRPLPEVADYLGNLPLGPPYPGAKPQFRIEADLWEDPLWLAGLNALMGRCLPEPKPKPGPKPKPPRADANGPADRIKH